jgi:hypothetical protein
LSIDASSRFQASAKWYAAFIKSAQAAAPSSPALEGGVAHRALGLKDGLLALAVAAVWALAAWALASKAAAVASGGDGRGESGSERAEVHLPLPLASAGGGSAAAGRVELVRPQGPRAEAAPPARQVAAALRQATGGQPAHAYEPIP